MTESYDVPKEEGPYEIVAPLGAGGMGEVYRARDRKLGRDVSIKVLSSSVSRDGRVEHPPNFSGPTPKGACRTPRGFGGVRLLRRLMCPLNKPYSPFWDTPRGRHPLCSSMFYRSYGAFSFRRNAGFPFTS